MSFSVRPLDHQPGNAIEVLGLTATQLTEPEVRSKLYDLWLEHGLIVFRDMDGGSTHVALSEVFGRCLAHPIKQSNMDPDHPEFSNIEYEPDGPNAAAYSVNGVELGAWSPLHTDLIYVDRLNRGGILRPLKIPQRGGGTRYLDKALVYETLPERLKVRIDGLEVAYHIDLNFAHMPFPVDDVKLLYHGHKFNDLQSRRPLYPRAIHPLVFRLAETGRTVLNLSPLYAQEIVGLEKAGSDDLLSELCEHVLRHPAIYTHHWRANDLVLWDNWRMLHGGEGIPRNERRWMQRTTIEGDYALGRLEQEVPGAAGERAATA